MSKLILIVEDDSKNLTLFRDVLQATGYETIEATDGDRGVKLAQASKPDLILMDVQMSEMDGLEATRILKADTNTSTIPIIALTAYAMKGDEERMLEAGCDGYLAKPIDIKEFLKEVSRHLSK